jgi:acyl-coenzyme A thioesterase PaaI-like protein
MLVNLRPSTPEGGMGWAQDRLDAIVEGRGGAPQVVETLRLGLLDAWGEGWVKKRWAPCPEVLGADGCLFGGHVAALADQILAFAAMTVAPNDCGFRTVNLQVQFFRVTPGQPLELEGRVVARTRQLISVEADFRRLDGEIVARASAQQIVTPLRPR